MFAIFSTVESEAAAPSCFLLRFLASSLFRCALSFLLFFFFFFFFFFLFFLCSFELFSPKEKSRVPEKKREGDSLSSALFFA